MWETVHSRERLVSCCDLMLKRPRTRSRSHTDRPGAISLSEIYTIIGPLAVARSAYPKSEVEFPTYVQERQVYSVELNPPEQKSEFCSLDSHGGPTRAGVRRSQRRVSAAARRRIAAAQWVWTCGDIGQSLVEIGIWPLSPGLTKRKRFASFHDLALRNRQSFFRSPQENDGTVDFADSR